MRDLNDFNVQGEKKLILVNYEGDVVILVFLMMEYSDIVM